MSKKKERKIDLNDLTPEEAAENIQAAYEEQAASYQ